MEIKRANNLLSMFYHALKGDDSYEGKPKGIQVPALSMKQKTLCYPMIKVLL